MGRKPGHVTPEGRSLAAELHTRQVAVQQAVDRRDEFIRVALDRGLGVRQVARILGTNKSSISRRYGHREAES